MGIILNGNKPSKIIYNGAEPSLYFNGAKIWPESSPPPVTYNGYMVEMKWANNTSNLISTGPASQYPTKINNVAVTQSDLDPYYCFYSNNGTSWGSMSYSDYNDLFNNGLSLNAVGIRLYYWRTPASFTFSWFNTQTRPSTLTVNIYKCVDLENITLASTSSFMMDQYTYRTVTASL